MQDVIAYYSDRVYAALEGQDASWRYGEYFTTRFVQVAYYPVRCRLQVFVVAEVGAVLYDAFDIEIPEPVDKYVILKYSLKRIKGNTMRDFDHLSNELIEFRKVRIDKTPYGEVAIYQQVDF